MFHVYTATKFRLFVIWVTHDYSQGVWDSGNWRMPWKREFRLWTMRKRFNTWETPGTVFVTNIQPIDLRWKFPNVWQQFAWPIWKGAKPQRNHWLADSGSRDGGRWRNSTLKFNAKWKLVLSKGEWLSKKFVSSIIVTALCNSYAT